MEAHGQRQPAVVVIGGANTDIVGRADAPLVARDSNPGAVRVSSGGVARNIAENLARLGVGVNLLTVLGGDHNARELERSGREVGIGFELSHVEPELPGSLYLAILDADGDMALALNDMRALERLTVEVLEARAHAIAAADLVVLDANLDAGAIEWVVDNAGGPVLVDPVSAVKAPRVRPVLDRLAVLKCNALEAAALLGGPPLTGRDAIQAAARELRAIGVGAVYITAGIAGTCFSATSGEGWVDAPAVTVVNATGAGDAFSAGVAAAMLAGCDARECAAAGALLAHHALASESTVSEQIGPDTLASITGGATP